MCHSSTPTLSLHDALPIYQKILVQQFGQKFLDLCGRFAGDFHFIEKKHIDRSEEHTSELQSLRHLVCRLLLDKQNARTRTRLSSILTATCRTCRSCRAQAP